MCGMEGTSKGLTLFSEDPSTGLYLVQKLTVLGIIRFHLHSCLDMRQGSNLITGIIICNGT